MQASANIVRAIVRGLVMLVTVSGAVLTAGNKLEFEVASIRPSAPGTQFTIGLELRHGRLRGMNISLKSLIATAYGVSEPRVIGPPWLDKLHFDIQAVSPEGVADREMKPMLQALLKERFRLVMHSEARKMSEYTLLVAKGGPHMAVYPAKPLVDFPSTPGIPMMRGGMTMPLFTDFLSSVVGEPVADRTDLGGQVYNVVLSYMPYSLHGEKASQPGDPPDLFTALHTELGLKLEHTRGMVDVIVVDSIDQAPLGN